MSTFLLHIKKESYLWNCTFNFVCARNILPLFPQLGIFIALLTQVDKSNS